MFFLLGYRIKLHAHACRSISRQSFGVGRREKYRIKVDQTNLPDKPPWPEPASCPVVSAVPAVPAASAAVFARCRRVQSADALIRCSTTASAVTRTVCTCSVAFSLNLSHFLSLCPSESLSLWFSVSLPLCPSFSLLLPRVRDRERRLAVRAEAGFRVSNPCR